MRSSNDKLSSLVPSSILLLITDESGATMVEYAMLLALLTVGVASAATAFGGSIASFFLGTGDAMASMASEG